MTAPCKVGDRIKLLHMEDDPDPLPMGAEGTVTSTSEHGLSRGRSDWVIGVAWDNGRTLSLICPPDSFQVITT